MERQEQINAAHAAILEEAKPGDSRLTGLGKVRVEALQELLELDPEVTAEERDIAQAGHKPAKREGAARENLGLGEEVEAAPLADIERKAKALRVELDPSWSAERKAEAVSAAEERERARIQTSARLQREADKRARDAAEQEETVDVRIMKSGDGKISTGLHIAGMGDVKFEYREIATIPANAAKKYEARGWVEIL